jgi:hypothetical protein
MDCDYEKWGSDISILSMQNSTNPAKPGVAQNNLIWLDPNKNDVIQITNLIKLKKKNSFAGHMQK